MHYFVDGYNLLFRIAKGKMPLQQKRQILLETLASFHLNLTIVFDSTQEKHGIEDRGHWQDLEIVYTEIGQSADAYIKQAIENAPHPRRETVITSDRELKRLCTHLGAHTQTIEAFLSRLERRKKKQASKTPQFKESTTQFNRLLAIFEKRLKDPD